MKPEKNQDAEQHDQNTVEPFPFVHVIVVVVADGYVAVTVTVTFVVAVTVAIAVAVVILIVAVEKCIGLAAVPAAIITSQRSCHVQGRGA